MKNSSSFHLRPRIMSFRRIFKLAPGSEHFCVAGPNGWQFQVTFRRPICSSAAITHLERREIITRHLHRPGVRLLSFPAGCVARASITGTKCRNSSKCGYFQRAHLPNSVGICMETANARPHSNPQTEQIVKGSTLQLYGSLTLNDTSLCPQPANKITEIENICESRLT